MKSETKLDPLVDKFASASIPKLSKKSQKMYANDVRAFLKNFGGDAALVTTAVIDDYLHSRFEQGVRSSTLNRRLASLRRFYKWAVDNALLTHDPALAAKSYEKGRGTKKVVVLTKAQQNALLNHAANSDVLGKRNAAMMAVALDTGLPVNMLRTLKRKQFRRVKKNGMVFGILKIDAPHYDHSFVISPWATKWVYDYFNMLSFMTPNRKGDCLWVKANGEALSRSSVLAFVDRYAKKALGFDMPYSAFRFSYINGLLQKGARIETIQKRLGHKNPSTTQAQLDQVARATC